MFVLIFFDTGRICVVSIRIVGPWKIKLELHEKVKYVTVAL